MGEIGGALNRSVSRSVALALFGIAALFAGDDEAPASTQNLNSTCGNTKVSTAFSDTVYGALHNNGEAKVGPRRLVVNQSGKIFSRGTRLFVAHTPLDIGSETVRIKKTDGKAKVSVAICSTAAADPFTQRVESFFTIPSGKGSIGTTFSRTVSGIKNRRLSVRFAGKSLTDNFKYTMTVDRPGDDEIWMPSQTQLNSVYRPVEGFADLHAHHAGGLAFASGWYIGGMEQGSIDTEDHQKKLKVNLVGVPLTTLRPAHQGKVIPSSDDNSHQQMNLNALKAAHDNGLGLMVSPAVNSEWLCSVLAYALEINKRQSCQDMESAKYQILKMKQFDEKYGWYDIVTNPWEARSAAYAGRLPVVLGVEVSDLFPKSDGDWRRQLAELYDMGVRVVYVAHESNSRFAGAAYHHTEDLLLPNELKAWFSKEIKFASMKNGRNAIGLSDLGEDLIRELMRRRMLIDVDHASWKAVDEIFDITSANRYYPIYAGHTRPYELLTDYMKYLVPELNTPPRVLDYIKRSGGMVALRTGPEGMETYSESGVANNCSGSVRSLIQMYRYFVDEDVPVAFGSDFNGFVEEIGSRFGRTGCPASTGEFRELQLTTQTRPSSAGAPPSWQRYLDRGMSDIGTEPAVVFDMQKLGVDTAPLENSAQSFLQMWGRAYRSNRTEVQP
ncbi:MAG TPA: membrane dipeptidase [Solirubrobacterales bacterium]|nr:membrane dipeptidase [Solirubrobacterales bacterium]